MLIAAYLWQMQIIAILVATLARIQHFNPCQRLSELPIVCARVADHAPAQRTRNSHAELQSAPTLRRKLVQQSGPAHDGAPGGRRRRELAHSAARACAAGLGRTGVRRGNSWYAGRGRDQQRGRTQWGARTGAGMD